MLKVNDGRRTTRDHNSALRPRCTKKDIIGLSHRSPRGLSREYLIRIPVRAVMATKMGRFLGITVKRLVPCRCEGGLVKEPYEMSMASGSRP